MKQCTHINKEAERLRRYEMKVQKDSKFSPITVVIETQAELDWLYACLNTSLEGADNSWESIPYSHRAGRHLQYHVQMPMFNAIQEIYKGRA